MVFCSKYNGGGIEGIEKLEVITVKGWAEFQ
jgi:hypothetical protein